MEEYFMFNLLKEKFELYVVVGAISIYVLTVIFIKISIWLSDRPKKRKNRNPKEHH